MSLRLVRCTALHRGIEKLKKEEADLAICGESSGGGVCELVFRSPDRDAIDALQEVEQKVD